jgi:transcriptional regulator with XRE-family HTH domain
MHIGERVKQRRLELSLTQAELARLIGVTQPKVSNLERGVEGGATIKTAKRLARALGCSIDYLAGTWEDEGEPAPAHRSAPTRGPRPRRRQLAKPRAGVL